MFVDTHCHLNMMVKDQFDAVLSEENFNQIGQIIEKSKKVGVNKIINVGTSFHESLNSIEIAKRFESVFSVVGIHPCDCSQDWQANLKKIEQLVENKNQNKIVGVGETGLDFYHKPYDKPRQLDAFKAHIELSLEHNLPLVIHMRQATEELLRTLEEYKKQAKGVFHCFSENIDIAQVVIEWGFYIGIDGHVTYSKNQFLRDVVQQVSVENILLETDAPFLPPQEFRGKQNSPEYIPLFANLIADIKNISLKELAEITTNNAQELFDIG